jgi:hypothetical protein
MPPVDTCVPPKKEMYETKPEPELELEPELFSRAVTPGPDVSSLPFLLFIDLNG